MLHKVGRAGICTGSTKHMETPCSVKVGFEKTTVIKTTLQILSISIEASCKSRTMFLKKDMV